MTEGLVISGVVHNKARIKVCSCSCSSFVSPCFVVVFALLCVLVNFRSTFSGNDTDEEPPRQRLYVPNFYAPRPLFLYRISVWHFFFGRVMTKLSVSGRVFVSVRQFSSEQEESFALCLHWCSGFLVFTVPGEVVRGQSAVGARRAPDDEARA